MEPLSPQAPVEEEDVSPSPPARSSVSLTDLVHRDPPEEEPENTADQSQAGDDDWDEAADDNGSTDSEQLEQTGEMRAAAAEAAISAQNEVFAEGKPFRTMVRLATLDERNCPGPRQRARAFEISRKHIGLKTRNMVHLARRVAVVIDRIDDRPTVVFGRVVRCNYAGAGEYTTMVLFDEIPNWQDVQDWAGGG